ncbi:MAG TPA: xanthine dehydrogenase family protein molybdopterin-binding subunit [Candidatus Nitrosotalea sp.]|nr:xanthine dehydrogenase family protein molybdopterin-binding subunit [Candidatus Nitrosotalea sp.]
MSKHRVVGRSVPRVDAWDKVSGRARYAIDLETPGMLHAAVTRSERAHAEITGFDLGAALALPGVVRVVTFADLEGINPWFGHIVADHPILAPGRTCYYGEPVALVVADTRATALEAAALVEVDYRDLPVLIDADRALAPQAPVIHVERGERVGDEGFDAGAAAPQGNVCSAAELGWGDLDAAFAAAALVLEGDYLYPMLYGYAMEPYNALAAFDAAGLSVHTTAQHPYQVRNDLARIFGLSLAQVRVVVPYVGGGYGTKSYTKVEPLAAVGAWATGRPVKLVLSVEEAMLTTRSDSARIHARTAFSADGRILGREFDLVLNSGAYTDNSPLVAQKAANRAPGPYRIPALRVRARSVFTNTVPASSLRGFGAPLGNLAGETQIDEAADRLGLDPVRMRLMNLVGPGEVLLPGRRPLDADLGADLDLLAESLGWPGAEGRAVGFGLSASDAGAFPVSTALVRLHADGSVSVMTGSTELGQGSRTVLAQIAAEELGVELEQVSVLGSDTAAGPYERTTGASRTTTIAGRSLMAACADVRRRLRELAAEAYRVGQEAIVEVPGGLVVDGTRRAHAEVIRAWFGAEGEVVGSGAVRRAGDFSAMPPFWEVGVTGVELDLDPETGAARVLKLAAVGDVGFAIHPAMVHGQDSGAALMGLGAALHEELVYDGEVLANPNVVDYHVPRFSDAPASTELMLAERGDGVGPYGAKGGGEGSTNPVGGAVASAIGRATGVYPRQLPVTPERIWRMFRSGDGSDNAG